MLSGICRQEHDMLFPPYQNFWLHACHISSYFFTAVATSQMVCYQWCTQKISEGAAKFRHNRVTSQINFMGKCRRHDHSRGTGTCPGEVLQNYT